MITVEKITKSGKQYFEVLLSSGYKLNMYSSELRKFGVKEGCELTDERFFEIKHTCVTVRARKKVLSLLEMCDRPEGELRSKLRLKGYDEEAIDDAIEYAKKFGYIDDTRYAKNYISFNLGLKNKTKIIYGLTAKGIKKDLALKLYEEAVEETDREEDPEMEALLKEIRKKTRGGELTYEEKTKLSASLYRKGFSLTLIKKALNTEFDDL
ncbi:MAG: RecX family transcriptional regulator [Lachnospiraceae bacterium]|nr:RecX family transcriptional regulator [Lachnospiraceae bacterium]